MKTPIHTFLIVAAILCFLAAAASSTFYAPTAPGWSWHYRLVALGLFFWALSEQVTV